MSRDQRPRPFPLGLLSRHATRDTPDQDPPLPPTRLDPFVDRHLPIVSAAFRKRHRKASAIYFGYEIYISETSILTQKHMPA